jgi:hypothetical protein
MKTIAVLLLVSAGALVGCSGSGSTARQGSEKGPCYPNGTCDLGLSCFSRLCVRYDAGAAGGGGGTGGAGGSGGSTDAAAPDMGPDVPIAGSSGGGSAGSGGASGGRGGSSGTGGGAETDAGADAATEVSDGGDAASCDGAASGASESMVATACGFTPATTTASYAGRLRLTVSGLYANSPGSPFEDAFYTVDANDPTRAVATCPYCFRYNRVSEANCVCSTECASASHQVADILVGDYPAFRPDHEYTVLLDLGSAPAARLNFGMADCGCTDNSGSHTILITPVPRAPCAN